MAGRSQPGIVAITHNERYHRSFATYFLVHTILIRRYCFRQHGYTGTRTAPPRVTEWVASCVDIMTFNVLRNSGTLRQSTFSLVDRVLRRSMPNKLRCVLEFWIRPP